MTKHNPTEKGRRRIPQKQRPRKADRREAVEKLERGPSFDVSPAPAEKQQEMTQRPEDIVDEESMESFPASDPPSHSRSTGD